jgi:VanZ family protein
MPGGESHARILCCVNGLLPRSLGGSWRPLVAWAPVIGWAALIFALSAQPNLRFAPDDRLDVVIRKAGHVGIFGILALLSWRSIAETTAWRRPQAWAFAITVLYAASDELHQGLVAGRHPSIVDVGIDASGALIALLAVEVWRRRRRPF